jgi:hypothetical protein
MYIYLQACEQLNAWLGGFESILTKMNGGNFNWFLHTMLFMHTMNVIQKQNDKREKQNDKGKGHRDDQDSGDEAEVDIEDDEE